MFEMACMKGSEMFAEAIPGVIIQMMAIVTKEKGQDVLLGAWISLAISAFSTGFISASISYDFDTNPEKRHSSPQFYGYIPARSSKRTTIFVTLIFFSAGMLLIRCTCIVLLGLVGKQWVFAYIGADLALYLMVKIMRGDFWYWIPAGPQAELLLSCWIRTLIKIVVDFTSIIQFRHPSELGGLYWIISFVLTMGSLPVVIWIYEGQGGDKIVVTLAWKLLYILLPSTLVLFGIFVANIEMKYWNTFVSLETGKNFRIREFKEGTTDAVKAEIFKRSHRVWHPIEGEVRAWVCANWSRWDEEEPAWLNEYMRSRIPLEWIPSEDRYRESMRRSSVGRPPSLGQA
uniref:Uncharacterized protein n=1 Tax=Triparma pacifica TaxID=91992 RepID=A0A7S2QVX8_9STRA|mmetsp:Transcript_921/g.1629  ORF Transcript_921/g.1629 Transcript_921/m.1629 type:complete len:344 (+) Transcript_921:452-1483(+)